MNKLVFSSYFHFKRGFTLYANQRGFFYFALIECDNQFLKCIYFRRIQLKSSFWKGKKQTNKSKSFLLNGLAYNQTENMFHLVTNTHTHDSACTMCICLMHCREFLKRWTWILIPFQSNSCFSTTFIWFQLKAILLAVQLKPATLYLSFSKIWMQ